VTVQNKQEKSFLYSQRVQRSMVNSYRYSVAGVFLGGLRVSWVSHNSQGRYVESGQWRQHTGPGELLQDDALWTVSCLKCYIQQRISHDRCTPVFCFNLNWFIFSENVINCFRTLCTHQITFLKKVDNILVISRYRVEDNIWYLTADYKDTGHFWWAIFFLNIPHQPHGS